MKIKGCKMICIKPEVSICEYIIFVNPKHLFGTSALLELGLLDLIHSIFDVKFKSIRECHSWFIVLYLLLVVLYFVVFWGFFSLVFCNSCVFRYKYFPWFYWVWCLSEEHERMCDFGPFTGQIHLWEVQMEVSWRVSGTCLSLAVPKTESKLVQCMYFSSISISTRFVMLLPTTWNLRVLHILYILLCTLSMLMMKCGA